MWTVVKLPVSGTTLYSVRWNKREVYRLGEWPNRYTGITAAAMQDVERMLNLIALPIRQDGDAAV